MSANVYHGRSAKLLGQFDDTFGTVPAVPAAIDLRFSTLTMDRKPIRQADSTITDGPLEAKSDEMDETPEGNYKAIACLNTMGWWLKLMLGAPVTTGTVGDYTHTFTLDLKPRPSALLEIALSKVGATRYARYVSAMAKMLSYDPLKDEQEFTVGLLAARQVLPNPVAAWDAAPTAYQKARACTRKAWVYDVNPNSTIGIITGFDFSLDNDLDAQRAADNTAGYGVVLLGQPKLGGNIKGLFDDGTILDIARNHTTKPLVMKIGSNGTETLTLNVPNAEFDEPALPVETSKGLAVTTKWKAHQVAGAAPVTLVLENAIASY